jgi:hypothetical protein
MAEVATSNVTKEDQSTQNEYITLINKKIRALKKKVQNIEAIEKRVAEKQPINPDQSKLLESKGTVTKSLKEFEGLRDNFVEIYNNVRLVLLY